VEVARLRRAEEVVLVAVAAAAQPVPHRLRFPAPATTGEVGGGRRKKTDELVALV
jgi:hypothetical protein